MEVTGSVDGAGVGDVTGAGVTAAVRITATPVAMTNDAATVPRRIHGFVDAFAMRPAVALRPATWVTSTPDVNRLTVRMIRAAFAAVVAAVRASGDAAARRIRSPALVAAWQHRYPSTPIDASAAAAAAAADAVPEGPWIRLIPAVIRIAMTAAARRDARAVPAAPLAAARVVVAPAPATSSTTSSTNAPTSSW